MIPRGRPHRPVDESARSPVKPVGSLTGSYDYGVCEPEPGYVLHPGIIIIFAADPGEFCYAWSRPGPGPPTSS